MSAECRRKPEHSIDALTELAKDSYCYVRRNAAGNEHSIDALTELAKDSDFASAIVPPETLNTPIDAFDGTCQG